MTRSETLTALKRLRLVGCIANIDELEGQDWLERLIALETAERRRRTLDNRTRIAGIGAYKLLADFDWNWPTKIDRLQIEELMTLRFIGEGANVVLLGPNGLGKTMLLKNLAHRALEAGQPVLVRSASDLLADLARQESTNARDRRLRAYVAPAVLCIDEIGYLSYDARHADLLFEVVTRRYEKNKSIVLTTNKAFSDWPTVFPNAACVVTLVDRLIHRSEVVAIEGESYRLRDAQEKQKQREVARRKAKAPKSPS